MIDPSFISVANNNFKVKVYFYNLGKAVGDSVEISIKRRYADGSVVTLVDKNIVSVSYIDSIGFTLPINPSKDIGTNQLIVTIDVNNRYDELSELNNTITKTL